MRRLCNVKGRTQGVNYKLLRSRMLEHKGKDWIDDDNSGQGSSQDKGVKKERRHEKRRDSRPVFMYIEDKAQMQ